MATRPGDLRDRASDLPVVRLDLPEGGGLVRARLEAELRRGAEQREDRVDGLCNRTQARRRLGRGRAPAVEPRLVGGGARAQGQQLPQCRRVRLQLLVAGNPHLQSAQPLCARVRLAKDSQADQCGQAIPRKATSSFVRTFAGIRATARTTGFSARLSSRHRLRAATAGSIAAWTCVKNLRLQRDR